jgi:hypothetical protein
MGDLAKQADLRPTAFDAIDIDRRAGNRAGRGVGALLELEILMVSENRLRSATHPPNSVDFRPSS